MKNISIIPHNENGRPHGYWQLYRYVDDSVILKCFYYNGNIVGYKEHDWIGDELPYKTFYI